MNPKDKAEELIEYYMEFCFDQELYRDEILDSAKQCATKTVHEIIEALKFHSWQNRNEIEYYEEVKQELKNYE
jgi:hypothetical protein